MLFDHIFARVEVSVRRKSFCCVFPRHLLDNYWVQRVLLYIASRFRRCGVYERSLIQGRTGSGAAEVRLFNQERYHCCNGMTSLTKDVSFCFDLLTALIIIVPFSTLIRCWNFWYKKWSQVTLYALSNVILTWILMHQRDMSRSRPLQSLRLTLRFASLRVKI